MRLLHLQKWLTSNVLQLRRQNFLLCSWQQGYLTENSRTWRCFLLTTSVLDIILLGPAQNPFFGTPIVEVSLYFEADIYECHADMAIQRLCWMSQYMAPHFRFQILSH
jgi:hypothetical protein